MDSLIDHGEEERIQSIQSITTTILDTPPSCLEFSSVAPEYFVVGTYYLERNESGATEDHSDSEAGESVASKQDRSGSLLIFRLQVDSLTLVRTIPIDCAVLDLHFSPHDPSTLAVAGSTGAIYFYHFDPQNSDVMNNVSCIQLYPASILVLSLAWHPSPEKRTTVALSLSSGQIGTFNHERRSPEATLKEAKVHDLEAWTVAWSSSTLADRIEGLYSGGDDSALCKTFTGSWLLESTCGEEHPQNLLLSRDRKTHGAGVTAILPLGSVEAGGVEVLVTGSYDEFIRVLVLSAGCEPSAVLAEKRLGGGVWRLKQLDTKPLDQVAELRFRVLASCMHAGARVLEIRRSKAGNWTIDILANFEEHESMNYASDVQPRPHRDGTNLTTIVSSGFYDRKLCVWRINDN